MDGINGQHPLMVNDIINDEALIDGINGHHYNGRY